MASMNIVIDPNSGMPVEIPAALPSVDTTYFTTEQNEQMFGTSADAVPFEDGTFSGLSEPLEFYIPPEVQRLLAPGVDPFASVGGYVPSPAGAGSGSPSVVPTLPGQTAGPPGSGGLLPAIGGLPSPEVMSTITAIVAPTGGWLGVGKAMPVEWQMMPSGRVWTSPIHNRQVTGVRFGTLPMVVFTKTGGGGF